VYSWAYVSLAFASRPCVGHDDHALLDVVVEAEDLVAQELELELRDVLAGLEEAQRAKRGVVASCSSGGYSASKIARARRPAHHGRSAPGSDLGPPATLGSRCLFLDLRSRQRVSSPEPPRQSLGSTDSPLGSRGEAERRRRRWHAARSNASLRPATVSATTAAATHGNTDRDADDDGHALGPPLRRILPRRR
jgi:hypothetical protein